MQTISLKKNDVVKLVSSPRPSDKAMIRYIGEVGNVDVITPEEYVIVKFHAANVSYMLFPENVEKMPEPTQITV